MCSRIINLLIDIISGFEISISNTINKGKIVAANFLANVITNLFGIIFPIQSFASFSILVTFASFFDEGANITNFAKTSTDIFVTTIDSIVDDNLLDNLFADVMLPIKPFTELTFNKTPNIVYEK